MATFFEEEGKPERLTLQGIQQKHIPSAHVGPAEKERDNHLLIF
uniref:Uncharacterized protein n=1 Tax=Rhizophora mucronata TaxID=61149 RepID=A0A2P2Q0E7_RHIMU